MNNHSIKPITLTRTTTTFLFSLFLIIPALADKPDEESIALHNQALTLLTGKQTSEQTASALTMLRQAAANGLRPSKIKLAELHYLGVDGVEKNFPVALPYVRELAVAGHPWSQNTFGAVHEFGNGVKLNRAIAIHWYREAALKGNVRAMANLGRILRSGPANQQQPVEAFAWLRIAADHGDTSAKNILEDIGRAIPANQRRAVEHRVTELRELIKEPSPM